MYVKMKGGSIKEGRSLKGLRGAHFALEMRTAGHLIIRFLGESSTLTCSHRVRNEQNQKLHACSSEGASFA